MLSNEYIAGLFDGEGTISIFRMPGHHYGAKGYAYQISASITLRQEPVLLKIQEVCGGRVKKRNAATDTRSAYFMWRVGGEEAKRFCQRILPYLQIKHLPVSLAIEFQEFKAENRNRPNSVERTERLTQYYETMQMICAKGPNSFSSILEEVP